MGYAKYKEDIERTYAQNVHGTRLDFKVFPPIRDLHCPYCTFQTTSKEHIEQHLLKEHRDAAIFLEHDDRVVPERAVFQVRPVHLKVRCPALPNGIQISVLSNARPKTGKSCEDGQLLIIEPFDDEIVIITLSVGVFRREYAISFKRQVLVARTTGYLRDLVNSANDNITAWSWASMADFESQLSNEPGLTPDEERHRSGIYQYYVGLWFEQKQRSDYKDHLEQAFVVLKDFDDSLALLVSSYFLYRTNTFKSISPRLPFPRLRRVAEFFRTADCPCDLENEKCPGAEPYEFVACEIAITDFDEALFAGALAQLGRRYDDAVSHCDAAQQRLTPGDDQAECRMWLLRFRILHRTGHVVEARHIAGKLCYCPVESFRTEAATFLKEK